jgi:hypothetical protein
LPLASRIFIIRPMAEASYLPQLTWRTATAATFAVAAVLAWGVAEQRRASAPAEHVNGAAGFAITPPAEWTQRTDDGDGSRIGPVQQPEGGFAWMVVTTRFSTGDSASLLLTEIKARKAGGPVRDLKWYEERPFELADGTHAVINEFDQRMHGRKLSGWTMVTVRNARMVQVAVVVPDYAREPWADAVEASLRSLRILD